MKASCAKSPVRSGVDTDTPDNRLRRANGQDQLGSYGWRGRHSGGGLGRKRGSVLARDVKLHGSGFIVTPNEAAVLGLGKREGLDEHIRVYRNGRDLTARPARRHGH